MTRTSQFDITFAVPGMPFDGDTPYKASLGGSETAGWAMAKAMVARGHRVRVFSNLPPDENGNVGPRTIDKVIYFPIQQYDQYKLGIGHDVCVIQRDPGSFNAATGAKLNLLWCHDLPIGRQADGFRAVLWNIDRVIVVSEFMKDAYNRIYNLTDSDLVWASRNGIFLKDFELQTDNGPGDVTIGMPPERDRFKLVFGARPERGLDVLLDRIVPELFKDERVTLSLVTYNNPVEHLAGFYGMLADKCRPWGDRIKFVGNLSKRDLYALYRSAGVMTYPTPSPIIANFAEVSCISAMEAQACGLPVVTSKRGALPETLAPDAGVLVEGDPQSDEYRDAFVAAVRGYMDNPAARQLAADAGWERAQQLDWAGAAEGWEREIEAMFSRLNSDPVRLGHHLYRRNDIMPLKALIKREAAKRDNLDVNKRLTALAMEVHKKYEFLRTPQDFRRHYAKGGEMTTARLRTIPIEAHNFNVTDEARFDKLQAIIGGIEAETILDYGCGHGWSTIYFHNKVGRKWIGVDVDHGAVQWAQKFAERHAKTPADLSFHQGDHRRLVEIVGQKKVDLAICSEVLEHCPNPTEVAQAIEACVKPGGRVIFTMPYGPSEYATPNWEVFRNHVWEFQVEDLYDLFDAKDIKINTVFDHFNEATNEPVGFYIVQYHADHTPIGEIDLERHLRLQRPRQTLSVIMMVGDGPETLLDWCLSAIDDIADEIIIADCGMRSEVLTVAQRHPKVRIIPSPSPLAEGFEVPRNLGLQAAVMDWVLWIDSDERLMNARDLVKYLRTSIWHGLSIRQHHFAVDTTWAPDMPVRCFRRGPCAHKNELFGKTMRFYGCIHEHPELLMNEGPGAVLVLPDVHIAHCGYLNESTRKGKFMRNHPLLQRDKERYPDRILQKFFIMRDNTLLAMYEMQITHGQVTPHVRELAREVVNLYRKHFVGKQAFVNIDPMPYYRQALELLGEGIDVAFHFAANRDGHGDQLNGVGNRFRYGSMEEAVADVTRRVRDRIEPLVKESW